MKNNLSLPLTPSSSPPLPLPPHFLSIRLSLHLSIHRSLSLSLPLSLFSISLPLSHSLYLSLSPSLYLSLSLSLSLSLLIFSSSGLCLDRPPILAVVFCNRLVSLFQLFWHSDSFKCSPCVQPISFRHVF